MTPEKASAYKENGVTLLELLHLMRKKLALVITLPIVFALVAAGISFGFLSDKYTASVSMYVLSRSSNTGGDQLTSSDLSASQMLTNDFAQIAKSELVAMNTAKELGLASLDDYDIEVTSQTTTRVITLSVTGNNPSAVAQVANQMAKELGNTAVDIMDVQSVNVIDKASEPINPSGPPRVQYVLVALLAGLFVAIALVVLLDMLNTTIKSPEDAEETLGLPVLGHIPTVKGVK